MSGEMEPLDTDEAESLAVRRSGTIIAALGDERA